MSWNSKSIYFYKMLESIYHNKQEEKEKNMALSINIKELKDSIEKFTEIIEGKNKEEQSEKRTTMSPQEEQDEEEGEQVVADVSCNCSCKLKEGIKKLCSDC